jgi:hypothetical protein
MQLRFLAPPVNSKAAIESRRNPCYGFAIIADVQEHKKLATMLAEARDEILKIIDPDRVTKQHPIRSPLYIKQKFFHAAVFGMQPVLESNQFVEVYGNDKGLLNRHVMDRMCDILHSHLQEQKPYLVPVKFELMNDGTILARFSYQTTTEDDAPLLTLTSQLDPEKKFSKWDPSNKLRFTTVAVAICVIDKDKMHDELDAIQEQLELASLKMKELGNLNVTQFQMISSYDKRTLSLKHISMYANVTTDHINRVCAKK